jgi:hypothetical protein
MPKNRVSYECQAIYVGPSPSSGYHFINEYGKLNNDLTAKNNINLLKRINRVTNLDYQITLPREEVKQLGKSALASNLILNSPNVLVNFEYYLNGVTNEARLGFNVNHVNLFESGDTTGQGIFTGYNHFLFSGLSVYDNNELQAETPFWPGTNRSCRNIYAVVTRQDDEEEILVRNLEAEKEQSHRDENVISFGDCYLSKYSTSCSVGSTPKAQVSFVGNNIVFYTGSSGEGIPSINPKNRRQLEEIKFIVPQEAMTNDISVILPGDITVDLEEINPIENISMDGITSLGVKFSDIKIQNYDIGIEFNREDMNSIGYKAPASRRINFPIQVNLNFKSIIGDESTASLGDHIFNDKQYNVVIKMKDRYKQQELVRYDFKNAKLQDFNYSSSIEDNRILNCNFRVYCAPDNLNEGFFVSGVLSSVKSVDYLYTEEASLETVEYLIDEEGNQIISNYVPIY